MATITSAQSGNFSATSTWVGGVVPGAADDAVAANGHVVAIDTDVTVLSFRQAGTGKFTLSGGRSVSGNVVVNEGTFTSGGTIEVTAVANTTATITGTITGPSSTTANIAGVVVTGVGRLVVNGAITGTPGNATNNDGSACGCIYANVSCSLTVNGSITAGGTRKSGIIIDTGATTAATTVVGNLTGGSATSSPAVWIRASHATLAVLGTVSASSSATSTQGILSSGSNVAITITGNVNGAATGNTTQAISATGAFLSIVVTGNVTGGGPLQSGNSFTPAISGGGASATITVTGNVTAGIGNASEGISMFTGSPIVTVTGVVSGGVAGQSSAISGNNGSTIIVVGSVIAGPTWHTIDSLTTAPASATGGAVFVTGNITDSTSGRVAIRAFLLRVNSSEGTTTYASPALPTGQPVPRYSPTILQGGTPTQSDVRSGTVYGTLNQFTGTLAVPPAASVAAGVPVDNTVGTAAVRLQDIASVTGAQIAAAISNANLL